jgi:hypothetical protein
MGTSVVDPNEVFSDSEPQIFVSNTDSDSDPNTNTNTNNLTRIFKMVPGIAFICVLEPVRQSIKFSNRKTCASNQHKTL